VVEEITHDWFAVQAAVLDWQLEAAGLQLQKLVEL
jgi:hypothetical protein